MDKVIVPTWVSQADGIKSANTNWYNQISQLGLIQNYNISIANGTDKGSVYFSLNYDKNRGIVKKTNYSRIAARVNADYKYLDGKLHVGENLNLSKGRQTPVPSGAGGTPMSAGSDCSAYFTCADCSMVDGQVHRVLVLTIAITRFD